VKYKVYYANGITATDLDSTVPPMGVVAIVMVDIAVGWRSVIGGDYYILVDDEWLACDIDSMKNYLMTSHGTAFVLFGQMVSNRQWTEHLKRIKSDPELPDKTAYRRDEVRF